MELDPIHGGPAQCPDGHRLTAPMVKVGFDGCDCAGASRGGHVYFACLAPGCRWEFRRGCQPRQWVNGAGA